MSSKDINRPIRMTGMRYKTNGLVRFGGARQGTVSFVD